jgi:TPR repeat protein
MDYFQSSMNEANRTASSQTNCPTQMSVNGSTLHHSKGFLEVQHLSHQEGQIGFGQGALINDDKGLRELKLVTDQEIADAQLNYGLCLHDGKGVSIDFEGAAHYFKLAAD